MEYNLQDIDRTPSPPSVQTESPSDDPDENTDPIEPRFAWTREYARYKWHAITQPIIEYFRALWIGQQLAIRYLIADTKRHKKGFVIGVFTVFLVVLLVVVLENNVERSPIIFWRIAETTVGENDLVLTNGFGVGGVQTLTGDNSGGLTNLLVQQDYIDKSLAGVDVVQGSTGRWLLFGRILPTTTPQSNPATPANRSAIHSAAAYLLGIDSLQEQEIGLGRSWDLPPLSNSELYLSRSIVREIGLNPDVATGTQVILRLDLLDVAQALNIGGIGGSSGPAGAGGNDASMNTTISHTQTEAEEAAEEAREDNNTPEQNQALILRLLIERAQPGMTQIWDQPVTFGNSTILIMAFVSYLNSTIQSAGLDPHGGLQPLPLLPPWQPGDPVPESLEPLRQAIKQLYHIDLTPEMLEMWLRFLLSEAQIGPAGVFLNSTDAYDNTYDYTTLILDPATIQDDLERLKNGTETYGELLDLFTPFILQFLRIDTPFTLSGIIDKPNGKWAEALGSVVVLESKTLMNLLSGALEKILFLQSRVNMSVPIPIDPSGLPGGGGGGSINPNQYAGYPLEVLLDLFVPRYNASVVHSLLKGIDSVARGLQNNTRALMSVVQYSNRLSVYLKTLESMNLELMQFTNHISSEGLGFDFPLTYTLPLAIAMKVTIYVRYFLDNIFGSVIALLSLLGMLLIYSLLLNDVDQKTYEYGMLRALGMKQKNLIQILLSKSLGFSILGIGFGLFFAFLINIPLAIKLADFASISPDYTFIVSPIIVSIALGICMPLLANIIPISRALSKTLRDSLDVYHVVVSEVTVRVIKLSELGIDLWQSAISVLLIVVGFTTFYIVPYAFTFNNIPLFLAILNTILLGMLLGLCILAQLIQPKLEKWILRIILWLIWPHRKLYSVCVKNLSAHSNRNKKTSQMFLVCLAFLIFAGVMFNLQSRSLSDNLKVFIGADIQIYSPVRDASQHLKEPEMRAYLDEMIAKREQGAEDDYVVEGYSFVSYPVNYLLPVEAVYFANLPQYPRIRNTLYGVEENFLDVVYEEFYDCSEFDTGSFSSSSAPKTRSGRIDAIKLMFQDHGGARLPEETSGAIPTDITTGSSLPRISVQINESMIQEEIHTAYSTYLDVLVSEALRGAASVDSTTPLHISIRSWNNQVAYQNDYLAKIRAMVVKLPGFVFSSYRQTASISSIIISMDELARVMVDVYEAYPTPKLPPKQKLLIRLSSSATRDQREDVINGLRTFFKNDRTQAINTWSLITTMDEAIELMNLFFTLVGAIAMIMCFFILWLSFTANVQESAWEFGVLRAIGLNSVEVVMLYVYEAISLVLASVILGTGIGLTIAATLTLQFNLFTELPFHMEFPSGLFTSMLIMAFSVAALGSGLPAYSFLKHSISNVLRRQ